MRRLCLGWLVGLLLVTVGCGGGGSGSSEGSTLSGNWEIVLRRHVNPDPPLIFTGFLLQSGNSLTGSVILGSNCEGVGPVTGSIDDQKLSLTIKEFGQDVSLTGSAASMSGEFSNLAGGCTDFANTGTWSAVRVKPLTGKFHGTFTSTVNGTLEVSGTLSQGPNTGGSNASLSGTMMVTSAPHFCAYLSPPPTRTDVRGLISGTTVTLNLFGPDGTQITQIGSTTAPLTVTADGTSMSGTYVFPAVSNACPLDQGTIELTFP